MNQRNIVYGIVLLMLLGVMQGCKKPENSENNSGSGTKETAVDNQIQTGAVCPEASNPAPDKKEMPAVNKIQPDIGKKTIKKKEGLKVAFIELGSVGCVPCDMMKPVMKSIEEKYKGQVEVIFYNVKTEEGYPYAGKYGIRAIPTQVFLDKDKKEFFRHEGFFPEEEIVKILKTQGVK
jgi:thioredoxin 1